MPDKKLTQFLLLPKLELVNFHSSQLKKKVVFECETKTRSDFCPHCGMETSLVHDRRTVKILDAPHGNRLKVLLIKKKRWRCPGCKKVFTESIDGIKKRARISERMQRHLLYVCDKFANMKSVRVHSKLGSKTIYQRHYKQLELEWRKRKDDPWPKTIGIDEHSFQRNKKYGVCNYHSGL